jgi:uncharacterized protein DUF2784
VLYRALADLVFILHAAFVGFAILGGVLALRWRWMVWLHLPALLWGAAVELTGWICPLTPLENWLRVAGGEAGRSGSFIERCLLPLLYPAELTRSDQIALGIALLLWNAAIYGLVLRRGRAAGRPRARPR